MLVLTQGTVQQKRNFSLHLRGGECESRGLSCVSRGCCFTDTIFPRFAIIFILILE
jgi:hypothetical protein